MVGVLAVAGSVPDSGEGKFGACVQPGLTPSPRSLAGDRDALELEPFAGHQRGLERLCSKRSRAVGRGRLRARAAPFVDDRLVARVLDGQGRHAAQHVAVICEVSNSPRRFCCFVSM